MPEALGDFDPKAVYDAAAVAYEDASRDFWQYLSTRMIDRLEVGAGDRILDVPCGTGPSLVPAARRAGDDGCVIGVDYATQMLAIARDRVRDDGADVALQVGDLTKPAVRAGHFDAVACVLGIFFVDDMPLAARAMYDLLRPGGALGVAVFGERFFDPMRDVFVAAVAGVAPDLSVVEPWRRADTLDVFQAIFTDAGLGHVTIETDDDAIPLPAPADWWRIVMGSGLRRTVDALGPERADAVRAACEDHIRDHGIDEVVSRTRYAVVRAPA